jgi:hypothetical protein
MLQLLDLLLALLLLVSAHSQASSLRGGRELATSTTTTTSTAGLVSFPLPPMSIQFSTIAVIHDRDDDAMDHTNNLLRLKSPLKYITGEFLGQSFRIALAKPTNDPDILWFRQNYRTLQLNITELTTEALPRNQQRITAIFQDGHVLCQDRTQVDGSVTFDDVVYKMSLRIMQQTLVDDRSVLQQYFTESTEPLLQKHSFLSLRAGDPALELSQGASDVQKRMHPLLLTAILLVCLVGMVPLALFVRPQVRKALAKRRRRHAVHNSTYVLDGRCTEDDSYHHPRSSNELAAQKVLDASDRYLSRHRPDLLDTTDVGSPSSKTAASSPGSWTSALSTASLSPPGATSISNWLQKTLLSRRLLQRDGVKRDNPYDFAFQDWSRQNGTPIYIYGYDDDDDPAMIHRRNLQQRFDESYEAGRKSRRQPGNEMDFSQEDAEVFMDKLEFLYESKYRHYQKDCVLHDMKYRVEKEARQREKQLRRHEMELDLKQIESNCFAPSPAPAASRKQASRFQQPEISHDVGVEALSGQWATFGNSNVFASTKRSGLAASSQEGPVSSPGSLSRSLSCDNFAKAFSNQTAAPSSRPPRDKSRDITTSDGTMEAKPARGRSLMPFRRSRRSQSHGINERRGRRQKNSQGPADDVLTFGIAAYSTHLV